MGMSARDRGDREGAPPAGQGRKGIERDRGQRAASWRESVRVPLVAVRMRGGNGDHQYRRDAA